ncbi:hypothetical protein H1P_1370021 [Hyella patelloides LEGE 07179]|uniref:Uncharacterized protein n=1 Tax=Hyella patelloides LEGE 07179 TaxID=945734 RepID=A0A563VL82_9CYAN|nr:hypothetical protein H1P_1370021 [Hyella patelloides LEGE 07179]
MEQVDTSVFTIRKICHVRLHLEFLLPYSPELYAKRYPLGQLCCRDFGQY